MSTVQLQRGNAHVVIIIILAVAIVGLLGFVFWQNFLNKPAETPNEGTALQEDGTQTFSAQKLGITFEYPSGYTVTENYDDVDETIPKGEDLHTITIGLYNKDKVLVARVSSDFQGGFTCDQDGASSFVTQRDGKKLDITYASDAYYSATIVGNTTDGYVVRYGLTSQVPNATLQDTGCAGNSFVSYVPGISLSSSAPLIFSVAFFSTQEYEFDTLAEAEQYLASDSYKEIRDTIMSFNFR